MNAVQRLSMSQMLERKIALWQLELGKLLAGSNSSTRTLVDSPSTVNGHSQGDIQRALKIQTLKMEIASLRLKHALQKRICPFLLQIETEEEWIGRMTQFMSIPDFDDDLYSVEELICKHNEMEAECRRHRTILNDVICYGLSLFKEDGFDKEQITQISACIKNVNQLWVQLADLTAKRSHHLAKSQDLLRPMTNCDDTDICLSELQFTVSDQDAGTILPMTEFMFDKDHSDSPHLLPRQDLTNSPRNTLLYHTEICQPQFDKPTCYDRLCTENTEVANLIEPIGKPRNVLDVVERSPELPTISELETTNAKDIELQGKMLEEWNERLDYSYNARYLLHDWDPGGMMDNFFRQHFAIPRNDSKK